LDTTLVIVVSLTVVSVARLIYFGFKRRDEDRITRTLARRRRVPIRTIGDDIVRVTGRVRAGSELIQAPVSGRPCVAFHLLIEQWVNVRRVPRWDVLLELQDVRPFSIVDESAEAMIDPDGPTAVVLVFDKSGPSRRFDEADRTQFKELKRILESAGISITFWLGGSKILRFREGVLEEGEEVSAGARGVGEIRPDGERLGLREPPTRVVLRGSEEEPLLISDCPATFQAPEHWQ
jgi:hypothetical protein